MSPSSLWSTLRQRTVFIPALVFALLLVVLVFLMWGTGRHPVVQAVSLENAGTERRLIIEGEHFGSQRGRSRVYLSGQPLPSASYVTWSDQEIVVRLGPDASSGLVYVYRGSRRSEGMMVILGDDLPELAFSERKGVGPLLRDVDPIRSQIGEIVTVTGRHFGRDREESSVLFTWAGPDPERRVSPAPWDYLSWSDRELVVRVPDGAATGPILVRTPQGVSDGIPFEVPQPLGGNEYLNPRSFAVLVSVEVDQVVPAPAGEGPAGGRPAQESPPELYLWLSSPNTTPAQGPAQIVSQSAEPLFEDVDGMSVYRLLLEDGASRRVTRLFLVERYEIRTDVERLTLSLDMPEELLREFGAPDELSPADSPEIEALVRRLVAPGAHPFEIGRALFEYVVEAHEAIPTERSQSVSELLASGAGNSRALSALFVALARAAGLPARVLSGVLVPAPESEGEEGRLPSVRHYWAEFYVPAIGWVPVDPALEGGLYGERIAEDERRESYFGNVDSRRIVFSQGIAEPRPIHPEGARDRVGEHYSLQLFHEELVGNVDSHRTRWYDIEIIGEYPP